MNFKYFLSLFKQSSHAFYKNPLIILFSVILFALSYLLSLFFYYIESSFSIVSLYISIVYFLVFLFLSSPILSILISFSKESLNNKSGASLRKSLPSFKLWIPNFVVILITALALYLILILANLIALYIGKFFTLSLSSAQIIFFIIYFIGLLLILFLTYASFILVSKNLTIMNSIKHGISLAKKEYLLTLSVVLIFFVLNQIVSYLSSIHSSIPALINSLILFPYLVLILTKIVQDKS